jgi:hypothetical protein
MHLARPADRRVPVEAQLGDHLRGVRRLGLEGLLDQLVADGAVALGVAADPDGRERVPDLLERLQQAQGVRVLPGLPRVPTDHEDAVGARLA